MEHHAAAYNPAVQHMVASATAGMQHQHSDVCYQGASYRDPACVRDHFFFQSLHPAFTGGIESYLDPKYTSDPAAFASRLPYFPFRAAYGMYDYGFEPAFIRKRNERERQRVKCVNDGYSRLREHLPDEYSEKRLSKVETLRGAIQYIKHLQKILGVEKDKDKGKKKNASADKRSKNPKDSEKEVEMQDDAKSERSSDGNESESSVEKEVALSEDRNNATDKNASDDSMGLRGGDTSPCSSSCMFSHCDARMTSQRARSDVSEERLCEGWRQYSNVCLYPEGRRESRSNPYDTDPYDQYGSSRQAAAKGVSDADAQGYRFHPYDCQRAGFQAPSGFYTQKDIARGLKQEGGPHDRRNPASLYYQKFGFAEGRYDQLDSVECYNRSDQRSAMLRGYARGGESDGFKSDNSPSSSSISTSP